MSLYKRGDVYWYKFMWHGELIRETTKQGNDKVARKIEAAHRTRLAEGLVGIRERKPAPALRSFLEDDFQPYVETKHAEKPGTVEYYKDGAKMLLKSNLASMRSLTRKCRTTLQPALSHGVTLRRSCEALGCGRVRCSRCVGLMCFSMMTVA